jgi:hypothetical protein
MTSSPWHVDAFLMERYADGRLDLAAQASVESHLVGCADCQQSASVHVPREESDTIWAEISGAIAGPPLPWPLRILRRLRLPDADAVVLRASSSGLFRPWVVSVGGALLFAVLVSLAKPGQQGFLYLLLAPLVPALAVVAAYDAADPLRAIDVTTPLSKLRVALLRTAAAASVGVPLVLGVGLVVPGISDHAFVWLLPAVLLTVSSLVMLSRWTARVTACAIAATWVAFTSALYSYDSLSAITSPVGQVAFAAASVAAAAVLAARASSVRSPGGFA